MLSWKNLKVHVVAVVVGVAAVGWHLGTVSVCWERSAVDAVGLQETHTHTHKTRTLVIHHLAT